MSEGKVAVVGSGLIGRCWSMMFARAGYTVNIYDISPEQVRLLVPVHYRVCINQSVLSFHTVAAGACLTFASTQPHVCTLSLSLCVKIAAALVSIKEQLESLHTVDLLNGQTVDEVFARVSGYVRFCQPVVLLDDPCLSICARTDANHVGRGPGDAMCTTAMNVCVCVRL